MEIQEKFTQEIRHEIMTNELNAKIWCAECNEFTDTHLRNAGTRQKGLDNYNVIIKWVCKKCLDNDIDEISSEDWNALLEKKLTHFRFD